LNIINAYSNNKPALVFPATTRKIIPCVDADDKLQGKRMELKSVK